MRKILLLLSFGPAVFLLTALALWRLWPAEPMDDMRSFVLGGQKLRFAAHYVRTPEHPDPDRIELMVLAPNFSPAAASPQVIPPIGDPAPAGRAQIFITLTPAEREDAAALPPGERYAPYLSPEAQVSQGGLLRRRFGENSPFAGEDLYLSPPDGEEFFARCPRPRIPDDGLPASCISTFRIEGLSAQMRFDASWLPEWPSLHANLLLLTRSAFQP